MEKKVVISKRFRNNTLQVYQYLLKEFSAKTAYNFLERLEKKIDFIANNPTVGKLSVKRKNIRSILFTPHNQIFYRYQKIPSKYFASLICGRVLRKNHIDFLAKSAGFQLCVFELLVVLSFVRPVNFKAGRN